MTTGSDDRPYGPLVLEALAGHGLRPEVATPVDLLRAQVNDLYRFEIRRLRDRLLRGEVARPDYVPAVKALRLRYLLLSLPRTQWRTSASSSSSDSRVVGCDRI